MTKIAFVGAGSPVFTKSLLVDLFHFPERAGMTISLHDIDEGRPRTSEMVAIKLATTLEAQATIVLAGDWPFQRRLS